MSRFKIALKLTFVIVSAFVVACTIYFGACLYDGLKAYGFEASQFIEAETNTIDGVAYGLNKEYYAYTFYSPHYNTIVNASTSWTNTVQNNVALIQYTDDSNRTSYLTLYLGDNITRIDLRTYVSNANISYIFATADNKINDTYTLYGRRVYVNSSNQVSLSQFNESIGYSTFNDNTEYRVSTNSTFTYTVLASPVPVYMNSEAVHPGDFQYDFTVYQLRQVYINYGKFSSWVFINPYDIRYEGTLKAYIYEGRGTQGLYQPITSNGLTTLVYEDEAVSDIETGGGFYEVPIKSLYENNTLQYGTGYTLYLTVKPNALEDRYIIGYWYFNTASAEAGMQDITNSYLEDDYYQADNEQLKELIDKNNQQIIEDLDIIARPSTNITVGDIDGDIDVFENDTTDIFGALGQITSHEIVLNMLLLVFTIALVSYILFGKVA